MKGRHKIVPSSYLVLIKEGKTLLSRRYNTGFEDGNYGLVAGHGEAEETFTDSLIREAQEEADIQIKPENARVAHIMHRKAASDERVDVFFVVEKWDGGPKIMEPNKCDHMEWFKLNDLPNNTIGYIKQALECISNGTIYSEYGW